MGIFFFFLCVMYRKVMFRQRKLTNKRKRDGGGGRGAKRMKKSFRRRGRRSSGGGNKPRLLRTPVADRAIVRMPYYEMIELAPPVGSYSQYRFQSSCHDPNLSGTGHQPLWWDQYKFMYNNYRVHGFKYNIRLVNDRDSSTFVACNVQSSSFVASSSIQTEIERLTNRGHGVIHKYGNHDQKMFRGYVDVAKVEGLSKKDFGGHEAYEGSVNADPAKTAKIGISYQSTDSASGRMLLQAKLIYYVEFYDKISVAGS